MRKLQYPYSEQDKNNFIYYYSHEQGLKIEIVDNFVEVEIETENIEDETLTETEIVNMPTYYALEPNEILINGEVIINENYELELAEARKEEFLKQFFKIDGYGYFRKQPKGYGSAVESLNTAFNIVTVLGNLPANTLTFYAEPDFLIPEQCTEEWLVENAIKNEVMTPSEFGTFYAQFMMAWNTQEHQ